MALVDGARSELRSGDALSVLRRAAEHGRRFPDGSFAPEMLFLEMQAKLMVGRRESAADTARELVRRFPTGAQASRARELLESNTDVQNQ
jgi:TolA-binding protein